MGMSVTCYFRHLDEVFKKAGIIVTPQNKKDLDRVIHSLMGTEYKDCPDTWRQVKKRLVEDEADFVSELSNAWRDRPS